MVESRCAKPSRSASLAVHQPTAKGASGKGFPFCPLCWPPSFPPFLGTFLPFSPARKVLCSVEQRAQRRAWRGAVSGWTSPQTSGRKFLPEICVKKGQKRCPSFFVLVRPVWDFPDFAGIFPIPPAMVRGFSRFVNFLFLGLLTAPTRNSPERVRDTIRSFPEKK